MESFTLAIAWNWEFDDDFIRAIEQECGKLHLTIFQITQGNLHEVLHRLKLRELSFQSFYDRASDQDLEFLPLVELLSMPQMRIINPHHYVTHAIDKATMHMELMAHGLHVPRTIILPTYRSNPDVNLTASDLSQLSVPFVIKPANTTGGGTGVVLDARTAEDVIRARTFYPEDKYLLQEFIHPRELNGRRAWFRVYSVFDEIIPCWWDDLTHEYHECSVEDEQRFGLSGLRDVTKKIKEICKLDFFSSEIAFSDDGRFVVVDYVNEICDMRLKSRFPNGAPDNVVHHIAFLIAWEIDRHLTAMKRMD